MKLVRQPGMWRRDISRELGVSFSVASYVSDGHGPAPGNDSGRVNEVGAAGSWRCFVGVIPTESHRVEAGHGAHGRQAMKRTKFADPE